MLLRRSQGQARQLAALTSYFSMKERGEPSNVSLVQALHTSQARSLLWSVLKAGRPSSTPLTQEIGTE